MAITKAMLDAAWKNQFADVISAFSDNTALHDLYKRTQGGDVPMTEMELLLHFPIGCKVISKNEKDVSSSEFAYGHMTADVVTGYGIGVLQVHRGRQVCYLDPRNYKVVEEE